MKVKGKKTEAVEIDIDPKDAWIALRGNILKAMGYDKQTVLKDGIIGLNRDMGGHNGDIKFVATRMLEAQHKCDIGNIEAIMEIDRIVGYGYPDTIRRY